MSQSPDEVVSDGQSNLYQKGWNQLLELLSRGGSLSGRERNCCFLNTGKTTPSQQVTFSDVSGISGFDFPDDARALAWDDWDQDGDLDLWIVNRTGPQVRFLRNNHRGPNRTSPHHFLSLKLQGKDCNRDSIGARVTVVVDAPSPKQVTQTVRAGEGYLSQSSKWLHFGLGPNDTIDRIEVLWPSGRNGAGKLQVFRNVRPDRRYFVVQGEDTAEEAQSFAIAQKLTPNVVEPGTVGKEKPGTDFEASRVAVLGRMPMPPVSMKLSAGEVSLANPPSGRPKIINLWASWCRPCLEELNAWNKASRRFSEAGVDLVLLSTDQLDSKAASADASAQLVTRLKLPFEWGYLTPEAADSIDAFLGTLQRDFRRPLGVPISLLLDQHGQVAVIYRGPVDVDTLLSDVNQLDRSPSEVRASLSPVPGTWIHPPTRRDAMHFAAALQNAGNTHATQQYLKHVLELAAQKGEGAYAITSQTAGQAAFALGSMLLQEGRFDESTRYSRQAAELLPRDSRPLVNLGAALTRAGRFEEALAPLNSALELNPSRVSILVNRGNIHNRLGKHEQAIADWEAALERSPADETIRQQLAGLCLALGDDRRAERHYRELLLRRPESLDYIGVLAWILATTPDEQLRDGAEAVRLAAQWVAGADPSDPKPLNALAAALAALGQFEEAVATAEHAIELAEAQNNAAMLRVYGRRLEHYREGKPFLREPPPKR